MKLPLNKTLQEHLDSKSLKADQMQKLLAMQNETAVPVETKSRLRMAWIGSAAALLLAVALLLLPQGSNNLIDELAVEVVNNHLHLKPLEVSGNELASISSYFTKLDFQPLASRYIEDLNLNLMGGRYCSLQGITAAQLRFKSVADNGIHTLYQVGYDPKIFKQLPQYDQGDSPVSTWSKGVKVTLWVEKGVLFALTEDAPKKL